MGDRTTKEAERAEPASVPERDLLDAMVERSGSGVLVIDEHERVVWTNRTFREKFRENDGAFEPDKACHEVLCGKAKPCEDCPVLARRCGETRAHRELKLWVRDRYRHVYATAMPLTENDRGRDVVVVQDLTDLQVLQQSEDALRSSEQRFRSIFEKVAAGMTTTRLDGAFLQVNPAFCSMLGHSESDLLRLRFADVVDPEDHAEFQRQFDQVVAGRRRDIELEMRYRRHDGRTVWGQTTSVWQFDADGRPTHCIHLVQDVSQRKTVMRALEDSRQRYQGLIHTLEGIVWEADAESFEFSFVSPQAQEILGYPIEKWTETRRFWRNHVHPDDLQEAVEAIRDAVDHRRGYQLEYRMVAADGRTVWLHDTVAIVQPEDGTPKFRGVMFDITARKEAVLALEESEIRLRQVQKMEAIGQLAGGIAHDFNNILTAITGYAQLLQRKLGADHPCWRQAGEVLKASRRASELTGQLLAFSRQQVLEPKRLDLNEVLTDMTDMVERLIGENIELVVDAASSAAFVTADPGQVHQVMMNLAVNARDAMDRGGRLTISIEHAAVDRLRNDGPTAGVEPGSYVLVSFADTGVGMSSEVQTRVFEPFFTTKEKGRGTGLGLATVYGIVRQSGGFITVDSTPGEGTTFRIYLPRTAGEAPVVAVADEEPASSHGDETVLLVEDDDTVRELAAEILSLNGYRVLQAANGLEAIELFAERADEIALVVTDVVMPRMGGRELFERIGKACPQMGVLFLSGYNDAVVQRQGIEIDEKNFLQKPFTPLALASTVRRLIDRDQAR